MNHAMLFKNKIIFFSVIELLIIKVAKLVKPLLLIGTSAVHRLLCNHEHPPEALQQKTEES